MKTSSPPAFDPPARCRRRSTSLRHRAASIAAAGITLGGLASCIAPPPPRAYSPQTARHLWNLSHDQPVTPMPSGYDGWGSGYYYGCY